MFPQGNSTFTTKVTLTLYRYTANRRILVLLCIIRAVSCLLALSFNHNTTLHPQLTYYTPTTDSTPPPLEQCLMYCRRILKVDVQWIWMKLTWHRWVIITLNCRHYSSPPRMFNFSSNICVLLCCCRSVPWWRKCSHLLRCLEPFRK